jgi:hypothetical protein
MKTNFNIAYLIILTGLYSCKINKEKDCNCCDVRKKWYSIDTNQTKLFSNFKESDDYDVISEVAVKIIKSEKPIATGISIWSNDHEIETYFPSVQNCPTSVFNVKEIIYFRFGTLTFGHKVVQKTFNNRKDNVIDTNFDTTAFFIQYINDLGILRSLPFEMEINERDSFVKERKYGDFIYKGPMKYLVHSNIGAFVPSYKHVFMIQTMDTVESLPKHIYIDKEFGLIRITLNNGNVWDVIH